MEDGSGVCLNSPGGHGRLGLPLIVALMVDGKQLVANVIKVAERPRNLTLILGSNGDSVEMTGRMTSLNMFSSALSITDMKSLTTAGEEDLSKEVREEGEQCPA